MNLVIDVGNTRTKYAFFEGQRLVHVAYQTGRLFQEIGQWKGQGKRIEVLLSGSGCLEEDMCLRLKELADSWRQASPLMELPLKIKYATRETLGFDRIAICTGAKSLYPGKPLLVIDSGTALTFNYVDAEGAFLGGNISPGLEMRFRALHLFTARLPEITPDACYGGVGQTTETAIRNGVMQGMEYEVEGYLTTARLLPDTQVVLTGGNGKFLYEHFKGKVDFCEYLSFIGLNEILQYAKKN